MVRVFVRLFGFCGVAVAVVALTASRLTADPLSIDSLQQPEAAVQQQQQQQIPEIRDAAARFRNRDVAGAYSVLQTAVKNHPGLPPAEVIMAEFFAAARQEEGVRGWLEKAITAAPNDPQAYALLGQDALQNQRLAEATLLFEKARDPGRLLQWKPQTQDGFDGGGGIVARPAGHGPTGLDGVQPHLEQWLKVQPDSAAALQLLGRTLFEQKKPAEALEKLKAAKVADPKVLTPEAVMAQWYEQAGDRENATKNMIAALTAQPKDFRTRLNAADWAFKAGEFDQARPRSKSRCNSTPARWRPNDWPATSRSTRRTTRLPRSIQRPVLVESPGNFAASNNLALALCEQDDKAKQDLALQYAQINVRLYPKESEPLSTLGRVLFRLGRMQEADQVFRQITTSGKSLSPDTAYYIADLYAATSRPDDAKMLLANALKTTGLFSLRKDAEALQKRLGGP